MTQEVKTFRLLKREGFRNILPLAVLSLLKIQEHTNVELAKLCGVSTARMHLTLEELRKRGFVDSRVHERHKSKVINAIATLGEVYYDEFRN